MSAYRLFIKNLNNLTGKSITGSDLIVEDYNINEDVIAKATSSFVIRNMPSVVDEGNVCGMYDQTGRVKWIGTVKSYNENTIQAQQIISLFDDKWATKMYYYNNVFPLSQLSLPYENNYGGKVERAFDRLVITSNTDNNHKEDDVYETTITLDAGTYTLKVEKDVIDVDSDKEHKPMMTIGDLVLYEDTPSGVFNLSLSGSTTITFHSIGKVYNIYPILAAGTFTTYPIDIEKNLKEILTRDFINANDTYLASIFSAFDISTTSITNIEISDIKKNSSDNLMNFFFNIYKQFGILIDIQIPFNEGRCGISIGKNTMPKITIGNNTHAITNFEVNREIAKINKLIIFSRNGVYRKTYYVSESGITDNPNVLDRLAKIKTSVIYSDDEYETIVANKLDAELYNHEITCNLLLNSKIYAVDDFVLGRKFEIYYNGKYFDTILTGKKEKYKSDSISLTFGLVRSSLTKKIFEMVEDYGN